MEADAAVSGDSGQADVAMMARRMAADELDAMAEETGNCRHRWQTVPAENIPRSTKRGFRPKQQFA